MEKSFLVSIQQSSQSGPLLSRAGIIIPHYPQGGVGECFCGRRKKSVRARPVSELGATSKPNEDQGGELERAGSHKQIERVTACFL